MLLKDKVVVISGIGPGLGQELAYGSSEHGAKCVIAARTKTRLREIKKELNKNNTEVLTVQTDITNQKDCKNLIQQTIKKFGRIDCLLNSAYRPGEFVEFKDANLDDWLETMHTNFFGTMKLTKEAIKEMKKQNYGSIVMVNSLITKKPLPTQGGYAASKGALTSATKILAKELGQYGIRLNSVYMGWMWGPPVENYVTETSKMMGVDKQELINQITKDIPIGSIPDDRDCANAVLFLASDLANVITGANLDVNGGEFMP